MEIVNEANRTYFACGAFFANNLRSAPREMWEAAKAANTIALRDCVRTGSRYQFHYRDRISTINAQLARL